MKRNLMLALMSFMFCQTFYAKLCCSDVEDSKKKTNIYVNKDTTSYKDPITADYMCPICYRYACAIGKEKFISLPCYHKFCGECIVKWFAKKKDCPLCRKYVSDYFAFPELLEVSLS